MAGIRNMKSGSLAALAIGIAAISLASPAMAQERGHREWGGGDQQQSSGGGGNARAWQGHGQAQRQADAPAPRVVAQQEWGARNGGGWQNRGERGAEARGEARGQWRTQQNRNGWRNGWQGEGRQSGSVTTQAPPPVQTSPARRGEWNGTNRWSGQDTTRNRTYSDPNRNQTYRDPRRTGSHNEWRSGDDRRGDNDRWRNDRDGWRNDGDRWRNDGGYRDRNWQDHNRRTWSGNHRWDRDWRRDNRYDWSRYRSYHRDAYRIGRYYAPYGGYSYRRLGIGFQLDTLFFGSRYWIADPWAYRLPPAYGPYRWVRYFDDVLLVDIYSGEVVDVIYDFFW